MQSPDMPNFSGEDVLGKFKLLVSENQSLRERLKECEKIIAARDSEIEMLNQLVSEASEMRSNIENQLQELKSLREQMEEMKKFIEKMADFYNK
jgi:DNA repair exonuclease SbcCD ATPase subunit